MGRAISFSLADLGYDLILCARSQSDLEGLKRILTKHQPSVQVEIRSVDFSDPRQRSSVVQSLNNYFVDVLVNNVGMFQEDSVLEEDPTSFDVQMQTNLHTPRFMSAYWGSKMREKKKGHIINISSIASRKPVVAAGSYTVTKFALRGLTQVLREELKSYGVKVTEIIPGSTYTSSWEGSTLPADKFVQPEDIAQAVVLCLSSSSGANLDEIVVTPVQDIK